MKLTNKQLIFATLFSIISFYNHSQVGINTNDPKTTLDVNGAISIREGNAISLTNGLNSNLTFGSKMNSFYRIDGPSAAFSIDGMSPETGADGQIITLENSTDSPLTLKHDACPTVANSIYCPGEKDFTLTGKFATVTLQYNKSQSRWIVINHVDSHYGNNIQSKVLPAGSQNITASGGTFTDITDASITFTPKHATVYVSFSISGYNPLTGVNGTEQQSWFSVQILNDGTKAGNFVSISAAADDLSGAVGAATITAANFPIQVTPNVPVTIKLQGTTGGVVFDDGFTIDKTNYTSYMTIMD